MRTIDTQMGSASSFFICALYLVLKAHCSWYNVHPFWYRVRNISGTVRSVPSLSAVTFGSRQNLILGLNLEIYGFLAPMTDDQKQHRTSLYDTIGDMKENC